MKPLFPSDLFGVNTDDDGDQLQARMPGAADPSALLEALSSAEETTIPDLDKAIKDIQEVRQQTASPPIRFYACRGCGQKYCQGGYYLDSAGNKYANPDSGARQGMDEESFKMGARPRDQRSVQLDNDQRPGPPPQRWVP